MRYGRFLLLLFWFGIIAQGNEGEHRSAGVLAEIMVDATLFNDPVTDLGPLYHDEGVDSIEESASPTRVFPYPTTRRERIASVKDVKVKNMIKILPAAQAEAELAKKLLKLLSKPITSMWLFKKKYKTISSLGIMNDGLKRALAVNGSIYRLKTVLISAMQRQQIRLVVIGGSISRGAPFVEQNVTRYTYIDAIRDYWQKTLGAVFGSRLIVENLSLGGTGTDYFVYCLHAHMNQSADVPTIYLWELAANDRGRYAEEHDTPGQPLEQLIVNLLAKKTDVALLLLNFFRGQDIIQSKCMNYEDQGGKRVAHYYRITSISWRDLACPMIRANLAGFRYQDLFSNDSIHPTFLGHAQAAFLVVEYLRDVQTRIANELVMGFLTLHKMKSEAYRRYPNLPKPLFNSTYYTDPLCSTEFESDGQDANNSLELTFRYTGHYSLSAFKSFKVRGDKLCGYVTNHTKDKMSLSFTAPESFHQLVVFTHSHLGDGKVWLDNCKDAVFISTQNYTLGSKLAIVARNVSAGKHKLYVMSTKNKFGICAVGLI